MLMNNTIGAAGVHLAESIQAWGPDPPLEILYLDQCEMQEEACAAVLSALSSCKQMRCLGLINNTIGAAGVHLVESIRAWGPDAPLEQLDLSQCEIPEEGCAAVLSALSSCKQMEDLRLKNNTIGAAGFHLAESIRAWGPDPPLEEMFLKECEMPEEACAAVLSALSSCKQMKDLQLENNTIGAAGVHLAESIQAWGPDPPLEKLNLQHCEMAEEACAAVFSALSSCKQMKYLWLNNNTIGAAGVLLAESIRAWGPEPQLKILYLSQCEMQEEACAAVLSALSSCKQMKRLWLHNNTIGAAGVHLAESIRAWGPDPPLEILNLNQCEMLEEACAAVLSALSSCKQMKALQLENNTIGAAGVHLAESIRAWGPDPPLEILNLNQWEMAEEACAAVLSALSSCKHLRILVGLSPSTQHPGSTLLGRLS